MGTSMLWHGWAGFPGGVWGFSYNSAIQGGARHKSAPLIGVVRSHQVGSDGHVKRAGRGRQGFRHAAGGQGGGVAPHDTLEEVDEVAQYLIPWQKAGLYSRGLGLRCTSMHTIEKCTLHHAGLHSLLVTASRP